MDVGCPAYRPTKHTNKKELSSNNTGKQVASSPGQIFFATQNATERKHEKLGGNSERMHTKTLGDQAKFFAFSFRCETFCHGDEASKQGAQHKQGALGTSFQASLHQWNCTGHEPKELEGIILGD